MTEVIRPHAPLAEKRILIWHPEVHKHFQESLFFVQLRVLPFVEDKCKKDLANFMIKSKLSGYCIYPIYGSEDVLLRVWLPPSYESRFFSELRRGINTIKSVNPFKITEIYHWCWKVEARFEQRQIAKLTPDSIRSYQKDPSLLNDTGFIESGLVRLMPQSERIKFFTAIKLGSVGSHAAFEALLNQLENTISPYTKDDALNRYSLYLGYGFASALIKAEAGNFFSIWPLIRDLNRLLSASDGSTITHIVTCQSSIESDNISEASFEDMKKMIPSVNAILPELYNVGVNNDLQSQVESWTQSNVVPMSLSEESAESIRRCLLGVINAREEDIASELMRIFTMKERYLRLNRSHFVAKVSRIPEKEILRTIGIEPNKSLKFLSIGQLLSIYSHALRNSIIMDIPKLNAPEWGQIAELRNKIAHGEIDILPNWQDSLSKFVAFLNNFQQLESMINEVIKPAQVS